MIQAKQKLNPTKMICKKTKQSPLYWSKLPSLIFFLQHL